MVMGSEIESENARWWKKRILENFILFYFLLSVGKIKKDNDIIGN